MRVTETDNGGNKNKSYAGFVRTRRNKEETIAGACFRAGELSVVESLAGLRNHYPHHDRQLW